MPDTKQDTKPDSAAAQKPYNSPALDAIRQKIDELDNRVHDALIERAELVLQIGEEKKKNHIQIVQPAREARLIRRLLGRHKGVLPEMAVVRIWRELVGAVSLLQTGLKVTVAQADKHDSDHWDMARDYFGSCLPMSWSPSSVSAISDVKDGKATFAVLPRPDIEEEQPWWAHLASNAAEPLSIIISLPHGEDPENKNPQARALVVSRSGFDDSGDDNSFILIQCAADISRGRLVDLAKKSAMEPIHISSKRNSSPYMPAMHLMEVRDYFGNADKRLKDFIASLDDSGANAICVGGYPVPPKYARVVKSPDTVEETPLQVQS